MLWVTTLLFLATTARLAAQETVFVGGELDQYLRLLELTGQIRGAAVVWRPLPAGTSARFGLVADSGHLWRNRYRLRPDSLPAPRPAVTLIGASGEVVYNSNFPRTANDGALWAGRGPSSVISAGYVATLGPLVATLYPSFTWAFNQKYLILPATFPDRPTYAFPWSDALDSPQRFGTSSVTRYDWGQSGIRLNLAGFSAGFSNENLWWGPGFRNAIILSNTAPGFPHADLGTRGAVSTRIGRIEARAIWGLLRESPWFDANPDNNRRFFTGAVLGYQPRYLPGLTVGLTRVLYEAWPAGGLKPGDFVVFLGDLFNQGDRPLPGGGTGNDLRDQLLSLVFRWTLPESGFEAYAEWARNDFSGSLRDFLVEPDHSRGYTAGFQKALPSGTGTLRLAGEFTNLARSSTHLLRANPTFYVHGLVVQGYTHRGQLMGAGIGPGSNSQYLGIDRFWTGGRWGVFFERIRYYDDMAFDRFISRLLGYEYHQVDLTLGGSIYRFAGPLDIGGSFEITRELNRYFVRKGDATNLKLGLSVGWKPRSSGTRPTRTARSPRSRSESPP